MADISSAFSRLADPGVWERGVYVLVGGAAPVIVENLAASSFDGDTPLPAEAYGALTAGALFWLAPQGKVRNYSTAGSLAHTGFRAAERFDLVSTIEGIGTNGGS